jgi:Holliday junction resolvase
MKPIILEADVKRSLKRYLKARGWLVTTNVQQGFGCVRGRPDLEALKKGITIYIECKRPGEKPTPAQREYLMMLKSYGAICLVISSGDEIVRDIDEVEERLWGNGSPRLC